MRPFEFAKATDATQAILLAAAPGTMFLGGGTNLFDLMKGGVANPTRLIDITALPFTAIQPLAGGGVRIGSLARNSDVANDPHVRRHYPLLAQALLAGASPQLRNVATVGGNLLQRTRCLYFVDTVFDRCNKRAPGSGCAARTGYNRMHAILGASEACVATNPSDMSVALAALDAVVHVQGPARSRAIPIAEFHCLPGSTPERDTELAPGELITGVELPSSAFAEHSRYLKVSDRASFAFALVSVAVGLSIECNTVRDSRIVLGGVAPKPWRAAEAEQAIRGQPLDAAHLEAAANLAPAGARPLADNEFKVELVRRTVSRALRSAAGLA